MVFSFSFSKYTIESSSRRPQEEGQTLIFSIEIRTLLAFLTIWNKPISQILPKKEVIRRDGNEISTKLKSLSLLL